MLQMMVAVQARFPSATTVKAYSPNKLFQLLRNQTAFGEALWDDADFKAYGYPCSRLQLKTNGAQLPINEDIVIASTQVSVSSFMHNHRDSQHNTLLLPVRQSWLETELCGSHLEGFCTPDLQILTLSPWDQIEGTGNRFDEVVD